LDYAGDEHRPGAEILTMLILGTVLKRLGWRLLPWSSGFSEHVARFAIYSWAPTPGAVITVQLLHGICYAFFFRHGLYFRGRIFSQGRALQCAGPVLTRSSWGWVRCWQNSICPYLMQTAFTHNGVTDFKNLFFVPLVAALLAAIALALFFRRPSETAARASSSSSDGRLNPGSDWQSALQRSLYDPSVFDFLELAHSRFGGQGAE